MAGDEQAGGDPIAPEDEDPGRKRAGEEGHSGKEGSAWDESKGEASETPGGPGVYSKDEENDD